MIAVTFDYGQTLFELDTGMLARRVAERGANVEQRALDAEEPKAWEAYNAAKRSGEAGFEAWGAFMRTLLERAGVHTETRRGPEVARELVEWLWSEQPGKNLWRRPIAGMEDLVRDLAARGVPLGIVSNSEGRLAELLEEMGFAGYFGIVGDSGKLGFEKPDRRIFDYVADGLGMRAADLVHVGDAWAADVEGALAAGARAIWITDRPDTDALPAGVLAARTAKDVREALRAFGVPV